MKRLVSGCMAAALVWSLPLTVHAATLDIGIYGEPASLDAARVTGAVYDNDVLGDLFEGLVTLAPDGDYQPGVATDWSVSDDGLTWTFNLREDARWSDGEPVTAEDFVLAFQRALDPSIASIYANLLYPLDNAAAINRGEAELDTLGVHAANDHRLEVTLEQPTPYLPTLMAHIIAAPVPAHLVREHGNDWTQLSNIASNGAFMPSRWVSHDHIEAVKNPQFHDADSVTLDGVNYHLVEDLNTGLSRFRSGNLDVMRDFDASRYQWLKDNLSDAVHLHNQLSTYYYALNNREGHPTSDVRVREALNLALRRDIIVEKVLQGAANATSSLVPDGTAHYEMQTMPGVEGDIDARMDRAKTLLKEAGYGPEHPLDLRLRFNSRDDHRRIAVAAAAMWKPLGINIEMVNAEANVHYAEIARGDFDIARASWVADFDDASNFLGILASGNTKNYSGYKSAEFDDLLAQATAEADPDERRELLEQAERQALGDYAMAPIYADAARNLVNPDMSGWEDNAINRHLSRWISINP
ncbi:peptide ABC transporter substrate-binding protein [Kushneria indalinina]|uniref:Oligopeptide transport system substrate-binding protein n=1 Tax=Kushneria indalinina DSM 14324 TaxID=1122140 RepID=A0A3D9DTF2_9GAMM|nr:peptide ABC transporter substrate-binding protein [Kushneria indalinina]REC94026.1 oligopeptide transport system substrate-binding protein [Kushneria indalinina DSM 14324]